MSEFNPLDTFRLESVTLYREGMAEADKIDIKQMMLELSYHEDMFSGTTFATMALSDPINLPESFPIVGGECIDIRFKSPQYADMQLLTFVIAKIRDRPINDLSNKQQYVLSLITQDRYRDLKKDISMAFDGTYSDIVERLLQLLGSTKGVTRDPSNYNQKFICPYWSVLRACEWIASRAYGIKQDPFMFWETLDGYQFRSMWNIYNQPPYADLRIEPHQQSQLASKTWRRVMKMERASSANRMRELEEGAFGVKVTLLNSMTRRVEQQEFNYKELSNAPDFAKIDKFPLYPEVEDIFKSKFMFTRSDMSHEGQVYRNMIMSNMDHYRVKVAVAGDSGYRAGQIVTLSIPDQSISKQTEESTTSGRWLIVSLRHLINDESFVTSLELCKDSHAVDVFTQIEGQQNESGRNERAAASNPAGEPKDPAAAKRIPDAK